jgi:hypothetical protein
MNWYKKSKEVNSENIPSSCKSGDCYCAAGRYLMDNGLKNKNLLLVHGEVTGQGKIHGVQYGHAWIEDGENIIDVSQRKFLQIPKIIYYSIGQIDESKVFKYSYKDLLKKTLQTGHWGPWELITKY